MISKDLLRKCRLQQRPLVRNKFFLCSLRHFVLYVDPEIGIACRRSMQIQVNVTVVQIPKASENSMKIAISMRGTSTKIVKIRCFMLEIYLLKTYFLCT